VPSPPLTSKLQRFGTTIFAEMSALATATGSINLGQGFPDTDGPEEVLEAAVAAIHDGFNQYPPGPGHAVLREAVARHQERFYGLVHDPDTEVLVTAGATEALAGALLGMLDAGDEVVVFDPTYDSYPPCIAMAGACAVPVPLRPDATGVFRFDPDQLRAAVTSRTKVLLVNTPHNPTGRVFDGDALAAIAAIAIDHGLWVVTDDVYEHLVFPGATHVPLATLPGMAERTLTISSGGKTFNTTGWKVGWVCGPAAMVQAVRTAKQFLTYVNAGPFQPAIAVGLDLGDDFYRGLAADLTAKRDRLVDGLRAAGMTTLVPEATYFATVDIRSIEPDGDGVDFCRALPGRCGVVAIPSQVMYLDPELGRPFVRFACCKRLDVLDDAAERLAKLGSP
jgi:N-succinyldiaminopimelate aminotransferase